MTGMAHAGGEPAVGGPTAEEPTVDEPTVGESARTDAQPASAPSNRPQRVPWPAVAAFVVISFGLAWLAVLPLWMNGGLRNPLAGILLPVMMFTPLIAALLVVFFVQKPRPHRIPEYLGLWPLRPVWRVVGLSLAGLFGSVLLVFAGVFLAAALGIVRLDLVHFSGFAALIDEQLAAQGAGSLPLPIGVLVLVQLAAIPVGAIVNGFVTVGEELGWRGWLLPSLRPLGTWPALVVTGVIWGLWHSPVILLGYNFGQPDLLGVALMVGGCTLYGILIGWLRLRSGSVWPAVFAHGAYNAAAGAAVLLTAAGSTAPASALNPLGWVTWIVMALVILVLALSGQFAKQPALERRTRRTS
ncbi:CPBP family intramembrane glutamic endopeptidase [Leifsonia poae]|nr:CPBP family intramembrane glutamic endopeptidase [Leifsonia poae]